MLVACSNWVQIREGGMIKQLELSRIAFRIVGPKVVDIGIHLI
jgi:ribosomal protein S14